MNLVFAIKAIEEEISKRDREYQKQMEPYIESLKQLRKLNTACEYCNGDGKVLRHRTCAEDDTPDPNDPRDYIKCPVCFGSGKAVKSED